MTPLLSGLDTVECAYYLRPTALCAIDFRHVAIEKEVLRQSKKRESRKIEIGGIDFFLQPYGTGSGYPFLIENEGMSIEFGEFNEPSFYVTYRRPRCRRKIASTARIGKYKLFRSAKAT